tara:strand:+ start:1287 stop:1616 length:330 start_codon:yes stop_codon:yes gene_type:complete
MDYDSENCDDYAEIPDEILYELKENSDLKSVSLFKDYISKEPEFYGIHNISSFELLNMLKTPKNSRSKKQITNYQYELFDDLGTTIFGRSYPIEYYNRVFEKIYKKIYF